MTVRNVIGFTLLVTGLIAMPVPIIPGFPLLMAGAAVLGWDHPVVRPWVTRLRRKAPEKPLN